MKQFTNAAINQMDPSKQGAAKFFNGFAPPPPPQNSQYQQFNEPRPMPDPPQRNMNNAPVPNRSFNRPRGPVREFDNQKRVNVTSLSESIGSNDVPFNQGTKKIPAPVGV